MFAERDARSGLDAMGDAWTDLNRAGLALARGQQQEAARLFIAGKDKPTSLVLRSILTISSSSTGSGRNSRT